MPFCDIHARLVRHAFLASRALPSRRIMRRGERRNDHDGHHRLAAGLGLERYEQTFRDNEIDERVLLKLTADDLKELGINALGHRRLLLDAIAVLATASSQR